MAKKTYKKRTFDYKEAFIKLRDVHDFTFDLRNKLTPQRKAAITKQWFKNRDFIKDIDDGKYTFIPAKKSQIKNLKGQFPSTNKGIIYNHPVHAETKRKTTITGTGKKTAIVDEVTVAYPSPSQVGLKSYTFYIKFPDSVRYHPTYSMWAIEDIQKQLNPDNISVAIHGYAGLQEFLPENMSNYIPDFIQRLLDIEVDEGEEEAKNAFTGVYIIYKKKGATQKWINQIQNTIQSLF